jgi:hypothetical protein
MEWLIFAAPVPGPVDFPIGGAAFAVALLAALTPVVVAVRHAFGHVNAAPTAPQLRVIEDRKELGQQAA